MCIRYNCSGSTYFLSFRSRPFKECWRKVVHYCKKNQTGNIKYSFKIIQQCNKDIYRNKDFYQGNKKKYYRKEKKLALKLHTEVGEICNIVENSLNGMTEKAKVKYSVDIALYRKMINQIKIWIKTGKHPSGKIISIWNQQARAITRNKIGKAVEFGRRWIITRLKNGYIIGGPCQKLGGDADVKIADEVLMQFLNCFGELPKEFIYDRGGDGKMNHDLLLDLGIKDCIFKKGPDKIYINQRELKHVKQERALSEASIAILKGGKYGFNRPRAKSQESCILKGFSAILGANLNKLAQDLELLQLNDQQ